MAPARPLSLVWAAVNRMTAESKRFHMKIPLRLMVVIIVMLMLLVMMAMLVKGQLTIKSKTTESNNLKTSILFSILTFGNTLINRGMVVQDHYPKL